MNPAAAAERSKGEPALNPQQPASDFDLAGIFISYAREDEAFAQRLDRALKDRGADMWVYGEDIRRSAECMMDIRGGMVAADTVLFLLSPDSVASEVCGQEVAHAVAHNSRLAATGGQDATVRLWDIATGKSMTLRACQEPVWWVEFSHDDRWLAAAGADRTVRVWDVARVRDLLLSTPAAGLLAEAEAQTGLGLSPDGQNLVSLSEDALLARRRLSPGPQTWARGQTP